MIKIWDDSAWEDYIYWQSQDKRTLKRINGLLKDIDRNGHEGIGKPEPLTGNWGGYSFSLNGFFKYAILNKVVYCAVLDNQSISYN